MFILKKSMHVMWPAIILMPTDGGNNQEVPVDIKYNLLPQSKYDELKGNDFDLLRAVVVGWGDDAFGTETDGDGHAAAMTFSEENLNKLLQFPYVRTGLIRGYWAAQAGLEKN